MFENGEKDIFLEKSTFQRNFLRTRRKLFWLFNRSRKKFAESWNLIYEKVKLTTRIFSLRFFYGHVEGFFDNTWRRFAEFLEKKPMFFKKTSFRQNVPLTFYFGGLATLLKLFCQRPKYFRSMSENDKNKSQYSFSFKQKLISSNCFYGRVE